MWPPIKLQKNITKFLYGGYISIFGAPARLLSDRGTSFTSSIIEELCKILGIQWLETMPYHPQTSELVERLHQMIMIMIGKLGEDKKADLPSHLAEIVHAYNATWSAVTGYSPHYLMFGWWPRLPVDFVFPTIGSNETPIREASTNSVDVYIASVRDRLRSTLWEAQAQSTVEACWQKWYYDRKIGTVNLKPGDLEVMVKTDAWNGKRKIKDRWEEETWEVVHQIVADIPSYKVTNHHGGPQVPTKTDFFLSYQRLAFPCVWTTVIHGTGVQVSPHAKLPSLEVMRRGCHKRKMARWSPNNLPVKLPWGGKMGSCSLDHGHLLEHPPRMGEDHR